MFDELYTSALWRKRQAEGPLAKEREAFLERCAARGDARTTLIRKAERSRVLALLLEGWPLGHLFGEKDLRKVAETYLEDYARRRENRDSADIVHKFTLSSREFLNFLGRLAPSAIPAAEKYAKEIQAFIQDHHLDRGSSPHTIKQSRNHVIQFLSFVDDRIRALPDLKAEHIDAFMHYMGQRWCRSSMAGMAYVLRTWVRYCERRGWVRPNLAESILRPKVYCQEGLPLGPSWDEVASVIGDMNDRIRKLLRDRAILLLLSVYGLRAGEVCAIRIEDIDWDRSRFRVRNSKSSRESVTSLEPNVGEAILAYLQFGRPASTRPELFLRTDSPIGPLGGGAIWKVAKEQSERVLGSERGWNPHAFRHACARHLLGAGYTLKRISDHLVHRSIRSTTVYAKVDLPALREVAFDDLGGLV